MRTSAVLLLITALCLCPSIVPADPGPEQAEVTPEFASEERALRLAAIEQLRGWNAMLREDSPPKRRLDGKGVYVPTGLVNSVTIFHDWKGGDDGLAKLLLFPEIRTLTFVGAPPVSEEALTTLTKARSKLEIVRRPRVWLGIGMFNGKADRRIVSVVPGEPADKAGIKVDDEIVEIDGRKIEQVDDVLRILQPAKAGDLVKVTITRNGKSMILDVELADLERE